MLNSTSTCLHCGTINQFAEQNCVACGGSLTVNPAFDRPDIPDGGTDARHDWQPTADPDQLPGIKPFSVTDVLGTTLKLFTRHLWLITKIVFVIVAPIEMLKATTLPDVTDDAQAKALTLLLGAICNVLIAPALVYALMKVLQTGTAPRVRESFSWSLTKLVRFSVCAALLYAVQGIGYMLCIIPGIIIGLKYAVVYPVAIVENRSIGQVFSRSNDLTRGSKLEIFGAQLVVGLLMLMVIVPVSAFVQTANSGPISVIGSIVIDVAEQITTVLSLVMYLSLLRTAKQGPSILSLKN
jgi:hypothetical protein